MKLSPALLLKLCKKYQPPAMVGLKYKVKDLSIKTDEDGNPVTLFIGKVNAHGRIKGERYARTLKSDSHRVVIKGHWDLKGKST